MPDFPDLAFAGATATGTGGYAPARAESKGLRLNGLGRDGLSLDGLSLNRLKCLRCGDVLERLRRAYVLEGLCRLNIREWRGRINGEERLRAGNPTVFVCSLEGLARFYRLIERSKIGWL